jgi:hypothetical protein
LNKLAQWTMSKSRGPRQEPDAVVKFTPPLIPSKVSAPGYWSHRGGVPVVYGRVEATDAKTYLFACDQNGKEVAPYYSAAVVRYDYPISAAEFLRELGYAYRRPKDARGQTQPSYGRDIDETAIATPRGAIRQRDREDSCSAESKVQISTIAGGVGLLVGVTVGWTLAKRQ